MIWKKLLNWEKKLEKGVDRFERKFDPVVDSLEEGSDEIFNKIEETQLNDLQKPPLNMLLFYLIFSVASIALGIPFYQVTKNSYWQESSGYLYQLDFETVNVSATNPRGPNDYRVFLKYSYTWEGKSYTGSNIYSDGHQVFDKVSYVEALLNYKKPGQEIKVYVDPNNPQRAALVSGAISTKSLAKLLGLMFVYFSIVFYSIYYLRVFEV